MLSSQHSRSSRRRVDPERERDSKAVFRVARRSETTPDSCYKRGSVGSAGVSLIRDTAALSEASQKPLRSQQPPAGSRSGAAATHTISASQRAHTVHVGPTAALQRSLLLPRAAHPASGQPLIRFGMECGPAAAGRAQAVLAAPGAVHDTTYRHVSSRAARPSHVHPLARHASPCPRHEPACPINKASSRHARPTGRHCSTTAHTPSPRH